MKPDQYHSVLLALDQALQVLAGSVEDLVPGDRELLRQLEIIRSEVLKAESGHPFPLQKLYALGHAAAPGFEASPPGTGRPDVTAEAWSKRVRVMIVDDQETVRSILRALLSVESDFDVIAEAANGREAVELATASQPDIIIMDLNMPVLDGLSATREILRLCPETRVIVFSANQEPASIRKSIEAGAVGYVCKPATRKILLSALRAVQQGKTAFVDQESSTGIQVR